MPNSPFRYTRVANFDPLSKTWHVTEKASGNYLGMIRETNPSEFQVKRDQDNSFHSPAGCRREAARWLRDHATDPAIFDEDED